MSQQQMKDVNELIQIRRNKLAQLEEMGVTAYGYSYNRTHHTADIIAQFDELDGKTVRLAGRIMALRRQGKAAFGNIADASGRIQIYVRKDYVGEEKYDMFKLMDLGDFLGIEGEVGKTRTGEITIKANAIELLSKALRPMPVVKEKVDEQGNKVIFDAFADKELRYRQRYVDLLVNEDVRDVFIRRSLIVREIRKYLDNRTFLEVETPVLQSLYGGASARPFTTHHNALDLQLYLRIADELYLKRLIVGGFEGVYEISKDFRNEGIDRFHNPEFTMLELYVAYEDYTFMMDLFETMVSQIAQTVNGSMKVQRGEHEIDLTPPWPRLPLFSAIQKYAGEDLSDKTEAEIRAIAQAKGVEVDETMGSGKMIDEIFSELVEPHLIQPVHLTDYPLELSPLAKKHRDNPKLVERFETFVAGGEICNSFSELNDPIDQKERFEAQVRLREQGDDEAQNMDTDYIRALEYGMPPTAGIGVGIDRLVMLLTNQPSLRDVILFPTMRPSE